VTFNHGVEGSSPSALTKKIKYLADLSPGCRKACAGTVLANRLPPSAVPLLITLRVS
jgi:hypothetical protein